MNLTSSHLLANCLITGIDFFTEAFRCDVQTVVASLHWLSDYLVQMKFYLQALPVLALYQYFATFVCRYYCRFFLFFLSVLFFILLTCLIVFYEFISKLGRNFNLKYFCSFFVFFLTLYYFEEVLKNVLYITKITVNISNHYAKTQIGL